ncbi:pilus assembly protein TadG-related protein [Pseudarthrobacter oxydans]|uniref:pilus assembly protein TadG-related protein n=1 Tax=Pseudarthrobacter oxydans TaxID=1671 RepID=UPI00344747D7
MQWIAIDSDHRERGAAGVMVAVMMVVLIGAGALAVDTGQIYAERAQLQNAADAGALAGVDICSVAGGCTQADANAVAEALADSNSNDTKTTVQSVDLSVAGEVTVTTSTKNGTTGAGFLSKMFASALNAPPVTVGATATAKWLYPTKGVTVLPITFAPCEFKDDGLPHKILTQGGGSGAQDCNGLNPSNQIIPGGFAWLNPDGSTGCNVTAEVGEWSETSAGAAVPNGCIDLFNPSLNPSLANSTVALPVYKYTCDGMPAAQFGTCNGSSVQYFIEKWAGFKIQAWNFSGQAKYDPTNVFGGSEKGLYGTFVAYSADPALFTGGTTTPTGNVVVLGLIK